MSETSKAQLQTFLPLIVLAVLVLAVGFYDPTFFSIGNLMTVTADTMTLFLMASGVTIVIMMGGIDLSVQAVASMTSCILAACLPHYGVLAIPLAVLGGMIASSTISIFIVPVLFVLLTRFSYGKKQLEWLKEHHEELMEKARNVEEQNIDPELEYEIREGNKQS